MNTEQLTPRITPELLTRYPDQTCHILNRFIEDFYEGGGGGCECQGNLEDIIQTTTSYDDGGINIITAYLSDNTQRQFQIRNGKKGSQGNPGADGHDGADGQDATIAVGTTTTLPAGSNATVTDSGTPSAAVLDFGIPRGADGAPGQDGQDGQDGFSPIATVSKVGDTATITITDENGTTTATVTDGTDGAPGQAATITAGTTTTLPAGSSATVTNSGTISAAVFDFGIPKGDTGAAGQDGADGADGFSPIATVSKSGDTATITITDANGTTTATVTDGTDGAPGAAATITAGTTTTLSPGSSATVTNSGTSSAAVFDFGIPQGATGSPGADGYSPTASVSKVGDTATITITDQNGTTTASVTDGATGATGPANTLSIGTVQSGATAAATITGTAPNQTLNLTLPQGSPGSAATVAAGTTTTLPAGSSASVTNSGTSSAAVFDFSIPQGADGQDSFVPDLATLKLKMLDIVYPVGSIYMSTNNVSPQTFLGGTWAQIQDTFLLSAGSTYTAGNTGGNATINLSHSHTVDSHNHSLPANTGSHTLTVSEMPSHRHFRDMENNRVKAASVSNGVWTNASADNTSSLTGDNKNTRATGGGQGHTHPLGGNTGDKSPGTDSKLSSTQSILPPYLVVYVWKRTS